MSADSRKPRQRYGATSSESEQRKEERRQKDLAEAAGKTAADRTHHLLQQLYRISTLLMRFETAERTVPKVLAMLGEAVPLRVATILVQESDPQTSVYTFTWRSPGIEEGRVRAVENRGRETLAYLTLSESPRSTGVATGANSGQPSHMPAEAASMQSAETLLVVLPLVIGHARVFGAVAMEGAGPLDESDLAFINAAVNQLAIAIDRAATAQMRQARTEARRDAAEASERAARAELAQQQSESYFRSMIGQVKDYAIFSCDPAGRITSWNDGVGRVLGFAEAEFVGRDIDTIFTPEAIEAGVPRGELKQAERTGTSGDHRWMMRKDRTRFFASGVTTAVRDERGALIGFAKVLRDQTEAKRLEQALREADQRKNEFLATLAHELRNPLAPLRNALQLMKMAGNDPAIVVPARLLMERQLLQMVRLIDDLLDLSRVTSGHLDLRLQSIELQAILESAVETSRPLIESQQHTLEVALPEEPILLNADPTRLAQVFSNLLNNSAKYTERGGRITLVAERHGLEAVISVADTGIGIPREMLERVFEMFTQIDQSVERSRGGLGIGLTLVRRLVQMHRGTVEARSEGAGRGSEFIARLPVAESLPQGTEPDAGPIEHASASPRLRILVADDNADAATTLAMLLQMMGHDTHVAHDGAKALEFAAALRPHAAVLDIGMPGLSGYEVARRIRTEPWGREMTLVALTGWGQREHRERTKAAGFDGHLVKPVVVSDLEGILTRLRV